MGASRGRRDENNISAGDILDFWRVTSVVKNDHLKLAAEMKLPGIATLEFQINPIDTETCELIQHARFQPHGLAGIVYWYCLVLLHEYIFGGMIKKISKLSTKNKSI